MRTSLYKLRMTDLLPPVHDDFFSRLVDPGSLLDLFDHLPDVFLYVKDLEGKFVRVNESLARSLGLRSAASAVGKTDFEVHPPYWANRYREEDQRVIREGQPLIDQVWLVPDFRGNLETFLSTKLPLRDRDGTCIGLAGQRRPLLTSRQPATPDERGIRAAIDMITTRFGDPIEIGQLARIAGLSHSQFNRRFRGTYRMSPSEYLQRVRVHEATRLIADERLAFSEIGLMVGFYDQSHFTRTFKRMMGMTPTAFRQVHREKHDEGR